MLQSIVSLRGPKVSLGTRSVAAKRSSNQSRSFTVVHASQSTAEQKVRVPRWDDMWATLKGKVRSVTPEDAHALIQAGKAVLVDVRPHKQFDASRPEGAQHSHIPSHRPHGRWQLWINFKVRSDEVPRSDCH